MKRSLMAAVGLVALAAAGCDARVSAGTHAKTTRVSDGPSRLKTLTRIECPETQGDLRLTSAAADGQSCAYRSNGGEVELRLTALDDRSLEQAMAPLEAELSQLVPPPPTAPEAEAVEAVAEDGTASDRERARVRLPGLSIDTNGDKAEVRLPGLNVKADDGSARVNISTGDDAVVVNANDGGAEIRTKDNKDGDVRSSYILARDQPAANGWRAVGYEARGPRAGPIVVAVIKSRGKGDDAFDDAKDLLRKTVGR